MPVSHVCISIIDEQSNRYMAMSVDEQIAYRSKVLEEIEKNQSKPWNSAEQDDMNPFPDWVYDLIKSMSARAEYDELNRMYSVTIPGTLAEAKFWIKKFNDALQKAVNEDPERANWVARGNVIKLGITDVDAVASMSDYENYLRGAASNYDKKEAQKEVEPDDDDDEASDQDMEV